MHERAAAAHISESKIDSTVVDDAARLGSRIFDSSHPVRGYHIDDMRYNKTKIMNFEITKCPIGNEDIAVT